VSGLALARNPKNKEDSESELEPKVHTDDGPERAATRGLSAPIVLGINQLPLADLNLGRDEVHVWLAKMNSRLTDNVFASLSLDERSRAERFHFAKDRNHFIVARGLLRAILGSYLRMPPARLHFSYAEKGKPGLATRDTGPLNFNLAHSHQMVIYALSRERELGIDIEFIREDLADETVAQRFFSSQEVHALLALPAEYRKEGFFNCWTRKEAYIKARGEGLSMPLSKFDVSLAPGEPAQLLRNHTDPEETSRWTMRALEMPAGYVAAIVVEGMDWTLKSFILE